MRDFTKKISIWVAHMFTTALLKLDILSLSLYAIDNHNVYVVCRLLRGDYGRILQETPVTAYSSESQKEISEAPQMVVISMVQWIPKLIKI